MQMLIRGATGALVLATLAACSSTPPPTAQMAVSQSTVQRVSTAPNVSARAPVELQQARDKWAQAQKAMTDKDYVAARRLAEDAEAAARVAETKADAEENAANLSEVQRSINSLQTELNRRDPAPAR